MNYVHDNMHPLNKLLPSGNGKLRGIFLLSRGNLRKQDKLYINISKFIIVHSTNFSL